MAKKKKKTTKQKNVVRFPKGGWRTPSFKSKSPIQVARVGDKVVFRHPVTGEVVKWPVERFEALVAAIKRGEFDDN